MNRILKAASIGVLFTGLVFAQRSFGPLDSTPPDPATITAHEVSRLATLLDLTTAQATQITSILTSAQTSIVNIHTSLTTQQTALTTAIKGNDTATIDTVSAAMGINQGKILDLNSKAEAAIWALLTTAQQTKLTTLGGLGLIGGGPAGIGGPGRPGRGPAH